MQPTERPVYHSPLVRNLFAQQAPPQDILTMVMVEAMHVASLKRELSKRGLRTSGNKGPLKQRLLAAIAAQQQPMEQEQVNNEPIEQVQPIKQGVQQPIDEEQHINQPPAPPLEEPTAPPGRGNLTAVTVEAMNAGLSIAGNKQPLRDRLLLALAQNVPVRALDDSRCYTNPEDGFSGTAHWVQLNHNEIPVPNPTTEGFHAPTNRDGTVENPFYEFNETFDRGIYSEKSQELELTRSGKSYKKDDHGKDKYFEKVRDKGRPKTEWLKDHDLTSESPPIKWLMAMMSKPRTNGPEKRKTLFDDWTSWSNAKGFLGNCGKIGGMYPNWTPFSIKEIQQFVGLYILNGLNISPRIEYKF